ncbi:hypothetical protein [Actinoplanes sp. URMC 104]|uniref:hypothetical protein n=1 Tax=Actinoplanes sp. URMC 104 TaxID=3423409 RepID=UPI003F1C44F6
MLTSPDQVVWAWSAEPVIDSIRAGTNWRTTSFSTIYGATFPSRTFYDWAGVGMVEAQETAVSTSAQRPHKAILFRRNSAGRASVLHLDAERLESPPSRSGKRRDGTISECVRHRIAERGSAARQVSLSAKPGDSAVAPTMRRAEGAFPTAAAEATVAAAEDVAAEATTKAAVAATVAATTKAAVAATVAVAATTDAAATVAEETAAVAEETAVAATVAVTATTDAAAEAAAGAVAGRWGFGTP